MKRIISVFVLFLLTVGVSVAANHENAVPYKFSSENIPFGKTVEEVLGMVAGANIEASEDAKFAEASYYQSLRKYFKGGLYEATYPPDTIKLDMRVVKKHRIKSDTWDSLYYVDAYFTGTDKTGYTLFMVKKQLSIDGDYNSCYKTTVTSIASKLGKNYKTEQTKQVIPQEGGYGGPIVTPSTITTWENKNIMTFLLSSKGVFGTGFDGEMLHVSKSGWSKYASLAANINQTLQKKRERENQKKAKDI